MGSPTPVAFDLAPYKPTTLTRLGGYAAFVAGPAILIGAFGGVTAGAIAGVVSLGLFEFQLRVQMPSLNRVQITTTALEVPPNLWLPPSMRRGRTLVWPARFVQYTAISSVARFAATVTLSRSSEST